MSDHIKVHGISLTATLAESPWSSVDASKKPLLQPICISLDIHHDLRAAESSDDLIHSIDYSALCKSAQKASSQEAYLPESTEIAPVTAYGLAERILEHCLSGVDLPISQLDVQLELPKAVLRAKNACVKISRHKDGSLAAKHRFLINDLPLHMYIGLHPHEHMDKQPQDLNKDFKFNFAKLERHISSFHEDGLILTVEALASTIAQKCFEWLDEPTLYNVTVNVAKPAALRMADAPEISITRSLSDYPKLYSQPRTKAKAGWFFAALALGANLGDRFQNIEIALRHLEKYNALLPPGSPRAEIEVVKTSFLYETAPMYVKNQPAFINCACLIETTLSPVDLLHACKLIEKTVGRVPSNRFGPRAIDLDIITYGEHLIDTRAEAYRGSYDHLEGELVVPHPRMEEREFVLRPLRDVIPEWVHPRLGLSVRSLLTKALFAKQTDEPPMHKVMPFPSPTNLSPSGDLNTPATQTYWVLPDPYASFSLKGKAPRRTFVMATLNVTPDSFSDGAEHDTAVAAVNYAREAAASGADIIDVGGYSTRPGAAFVTPEEEIQRVVPAIQGIRADEDGKLRTVLISVDTFRVDVARAAVAAGANCINDVYALTGPDYPEGAASEENFRKMRDAARELGVPVIMMHSRGDAGMNKDYSMYAPPATPNVCKPVLEGVRAEIGAKVEKAVGGKGGLRRWQVMVDPGLGFSKTVEGNLEILRDASSLTEDALSPFLPTKPEKNNLFPYETPKWNPLAGYPILIGASRKSFLGAIISVSLPKSNPGSPEESSVPVERPAKERDLATAAAVACAIQQGAAVVRVHNVQKMIDVVKVGTALWS
ncbi:Dihydropteroate synthase [Phellopilus nigrolimitatus]|nr:Dihydropteroate synthase [Phellopilus nigrolimitatus]